MKNVSDMTKKLLQGTVIGVIVAVAVLCIWMTGAFERWEAMAWDLRVSFFAGPAKTTEDVVLILLDQKSLDWGKEENGLTWPWPRELYAAIVNFCNRYEAKALAIDVVFTEPSNYGVEDDQSFGTAAENYGKVAGAVSFGDNAGKEKKWPERLPLPDESIENLKQWLAATKADLVLDSASMPIDEYAAKVAVLSNVSARADIGGIYRRMNLFSMFDGRPVFSLGMGAYLAAHPNADMKISGNILEIDGKKVPLDDEGRAILRYRGPTRTHKAFSAAAVVRSEIQLINGEKPVLDNKRDFMGKYVLFGFSAPGLLDLRPAPVGGAYTGVEIHATSLDNLLAGDFMKDAPAYALVIILVLLCIVCSIGGILFPGPLESFSLSVFFVMVPPVLSILAYERGFWLQVIPLGIGVVLSIAFVQGFNYATEGRQKRYIKDAFKYYLSPHVIEELIKNPDSLALGGERRTLSIFFSDIEGFTSISEMLKPEELTELLNDFLTAMTDIIYDEYGTVDKYEGDAIIAFWNAPLNLNGHEQYAVSAALRCQKKLKELRPLYKEKYGKEIHMRVGLNTGLAAVGNFGSNTRFNYTMLGDAVNLAARLEGANKDFGIYSMISESTLKKIGDKFAVREIARLVVVGKKKPVTVFEPMYHEDFDAMKPVYEVFEKGLKKFYSGDLHDAEMIFASIRDKDPAAARYEKKCIALENTDMSDWQGLWVLTSK